MAVKKFGEIMILKYWRKKLWRIQGLPAFSCFIGNFGKKTWRIVAIRQIRQSFLPAKVLFYTVTNGDVITYVKGLTTH